MEEDNTKGGDVGDRAEDAHRHDGVLCKLPLPHTEHHPHHNTKDDQTDHLCGVPRSCCAAVLQAEKEHERAAYYGSRANPIDGFESIQERRPWRLDVEKEEQNEESQAIERQVNIEAPSPGNKFRKCTADDWSNG